MEPRIATAWNFTGQRRTAGLSTNFLVLQAQRDLATAQTNELRAQLDYRTALVDFDLALQAPAA